jgi:putative acetyltransferase
MAVAPKRQRSGIGSALVNRGLDLQRGRGCLFVVVLGHPEHYPRFGFEVAAGYGLRSQWEGVPDEAFMVRVFTDGALPKEGGVARYRDEFDTAM